VNQAAFKFSVAEQLKYPDRFWMWFKDNQRVYEEFERQALAMAMRGRKRYSARTIVEVLRWSSDISDSETTFRLNDKYTPGMARLFMEEHGKRFPGFFELRE
jgi:hypothetical protein